jgi:hypothetical protein
MARPSAVMRLAGITLPGKQAVRSVAVQLPEREGSRRGAVRALKSPARMARVGRVRKLGPLKRRMRFHSSPAKKNSLFFWMGPPRLHPKSL